MSNETSDSGMSDSGYVLEFDGGELTLYGPDASELLRVDACSGVPGSGPEDQARSDYGPIPEGEYRVFPDEYRVGGPGGFFSRVLGQDWGNFAIDVHPDSGTETFGRTEMLIHGGFTRGSKGCIDVGPNDEKVYEALKDIDGSLKLKVEYDNPNAFDWKENEYVGWDQPGGPPVDWKRPDPGSMEKDHQDRTFNMEEFHKQPLDDPGYIYDESWGRE
jgi:hypothetical protein